MKKAPLLTQRLIDAIHQTAILQAQMLIYGGSEADEIHLYEKAYRGYRAGYLKICTYVQIENQEAYYMNVLAKIQRNLKATFDNYAKRLSNEHH